ncbi:MAG TPA: peptide chain release factor N(5)-glutamine methyltransferase [Vicinamibacterales bacterium]|nr:peptide chain release factor N(5)-glutamine methyltransferase [Vicinamibacterales bacterium]
MPSVVERLAAARARLEAAGFQPSEAAFDAEVLARHVLGWDRASLLGRGRDPEPDDFHRAFDRLVSRRAAREPVAQIIGIREFWGLDFEVTPDVLTPRPETELIVEETLAFARRQSCRHVVDVGTGGGCLAVSIARELPGVRVTAVDTSSDALAVARRNAARHAVSDRITFQQGSVLDPVTGLADLIVSNPPYVPDSDAVRLPVEVERYEPHTALFGGPTGLEIIQRLLTDAPDHLADHGALVVEFGFGQAAGVARLATETGWRVVRVRNDLQGIPRTIVLARSSA